MEGVEGRVGVILLGVAVPSPRKGLPVPNRKAAAVGERVGVPVPPLASTPSLEALGVWLREVRILRECEGEGVFTRGGEGVGAFEGLRKAERVSVAMVEGVGVGEKK